jgi:hypothetical protein
VARRPRIPAELKKGPFTLEEARAAGVTLDMLRRRSWRRIGSELYMWTGLHDDDTWQRLQAWHRRLPNALFTGLSAAWLHRLDVDPLHPIEVAVPPSSGIRSRPGLVVSRRVIDETTKVRRLPATTIGRTLLDLRRRLSPVEHLVLADQALRLGLGLHHDLAEPAEPPMETRLRWLLLEAGLPRPLVQVDLRDAKNRFLGRADLYYQQARLAIEFDGAIHRDRMTEDLRRQNAILGAGYQLLRFSSADLFQRPDVVAAQVSRSLPGIVVRSRGA